MEALVRIGAIARPDPDPSCELDVWRADLEAGRIDDPEETRRRLEAQSRGSQVIVRLDVFAELQRGVEITRLNGEHVGGVWFEAGAGATNIAHAREMVASNLDRVYDKLVADHGVSIGYRDVLDAPVTVELDEALMRRVAV